MLIVKKIKVYKTVPLVLLGLFIWLSSCKINSLNSSTPESLGLYSDKLKVAENKMQEYVDQGKLAGISTLVMKDGKVVQRSILVLLILKIKVLLKTIPFSEFFQ
jgi:hypothetical protein